MFREPSLTSKDRRGYGIFQVQTIMTSWKAIIFFPASQEGVIAKI